MGSARCASSVTPKKPRMACSGGIERNRGAFTHPAPALPITAISLLIGSGRHFSSEIFFVSDSSTPVHHSRVGVAPRNQ